MAEQLSRTYPPIINDRDIQFMSTDFVTEMLRVKIPLQRGMEAIIDAEDHKWINLFLWKLYGNGDHWYAHARIPATGKLTPMHRLIADANPGQVVDHKNGNGLDNRKANLRIATTAQNAANARPRKGVSRFKGVSWNRKLKCWTAQIKDGAKNKNLGRFPDEVDAAIAYNEAAKEIYKDFAWMNPVGVDLNVDEIYSGKPGRKPRPWFRARANAWYVTYQGRQYKLVAGRENEEQALERFKVLARTLIRNDIERGR